MVQSDVDLPISGYSAAQGFCQRHGIYGYLGCSECRQRDLRVEFRLPLRGRPHARPVRKIPAEIGVAPASARVADQRVNGGDIMRDLVRSALTITMHPVRPPPKTPTRITKTYNSKTFSMATLQQYSRTNRRLVAEIRTAGK